MTSTIKVNNVQNQCGQNIINENSNTITIGASGDTIALASGASQTGFGRTGTVDWQTGSIKTATFTAANGEGYFANTSGGAFTMNLPAGTAGNIVSVVDYTNTFQTNNLTITPNGSQKIGGANANAVLSTEGQSVTFVYVDDTEGWKNTMDSTSNVTGRTFLTATGGTITTSGDFKIHTFTGPGTFCVSSTSSNSPENVVSYLVVAGGGGGGNGIGGGGGAGGFREVKNPITPYTASPLDGYPTAPNRVTVTATSFPITVGAGGAGGPAPGGNSGSSGANSIFSTVTSAGGGGGAGTSDASIAGGSGGGAAYNGLISPTGAPGGAGNTPPVSPPQGNPGGTGSNPIGAGNPSGPPCASTTSTGGGGATAAGGNWNSSRPAAGAGGAGATTSINDTPTAYAGGGGGVYNTSGAPGPGGAGGGGAGAPGPSGGGAVGVSGTANTGGGGGASGDPANGGAGGSGIVIIRYKFQ
jgi:hypothetical protein